MTTTVLAYPGVPDETLSGTRWSPDGVPTAGSDGVLSAKTVAKTRLHTDTVRLAALSVRYPGR